MMTTAESDAIADWNFKYGWERSHRGNLTRRLPDGTRITVYKRGGWFGYCIARNSKPHFSARLYPTEKKAKEAAMEAYDDD